jgi:hypothetical protein
LLKHEPSAQIPWQKTMLGLSCSDMARSFLLGLVNSHRILTSTTRFVVSHLTGLRFVASGSSLVARPPRLPHEVGVFKGQRNMA